MNEQSDSDGSIEIQVVGAIRRALEGAAGDAAALGLVTWLVDCAPPTPAGDSSSVNLLLDGIRALGYSLSTESPSGAYVPSRVSS